MGAAKLDITIEQGVTFRQVLTFTNEDGTPIDVSGWIFSGQIRSTYSSSTVIRAFTFTAGTDTNQKIVSITAANAALITVDATTNYRLKETYYTYNIIATKPDTSVLRILEGAAIISPTVTR